MNILYGIIYEQYDYSSIISFDGIELFSDLNEAKENFYKHLDLELEAYEYEYDFSCTGGTGDIEVEYNTDEGLEMISLYDGSIRDVHLMTLYIKKFKVK